MDMSKPVEATATIAVTVSHHALRRGKERLGLNRKAMIRHTHKVIADGLCFADFQGDFSAYLAERIHEELEYGDVRVYGHHIYIFSENNLVTVLTVPLEYRAAVARVRGQR